jgi:hypothetical protein
MSMAILAILSFIFSLFVKEDLRRYHHSQDIVIHNQEPPLYQSSKSTSVLDESSKSFEKTPLVEKNAKRSTIQEDDPNNPFSD